MTVFGSWHEAQEVIEIFMQPGVESDAATEKVLPVHEHWPDLAWALAMSFAMVMAEAPAPVLAFELAKLTMVWCRPSEDQQRGIEWLASYWPELHEAMGRMVLDAATTVPQILELGEQ